MDHRRTNEYFVMEIRLGERREARTTFKAIAAPRKIRCEHNTQLAGNRRVAIWEKPLVLLFQVIARGEQTHAPS